MDDNIVSIDQQILDITNDVNIFIYEKVNALNCTPDKKVSYTFLILNNLVAAEALQVLSQMDADNKDKENLLLHHFETVRGLVDANWKAPKSK